MRLLLDSPRSGAWNMAVDEVLLERAIETGGATVRIYAWDVATLSLGYFQKLADAGPLAERLPTVRRLSGGGAILHHHELTYSLAVPATHVAVADPHGLYDAVHEAVRQLLAKSGFNVRARGLTQPALSTEFLCFARGDAADLVVRRGTETHKVLGSAQRRRKGAILQHGSLVLSASEFAPQFPGLFDLTGKSTDRTELQVRLGSTIAAILGESDIAELTRAELEKAEQYRIGRYESTAP